MKSPQNKLPEALKKARNRELWLRPRLSTMLPCFVSLHSSLARHENFLLLGINFTFPPLTIQED